MHQINSMLRQYESACYSRYAWTGLKALFGLFWLFYVFFVLGGKAHDINIPAGVCLLLDCSFMQQSLIQRLLMLSAFVLVILYVLEIRMRWTLLLLSILSVLVFSYSDSSGVLNRWQGFTMCFVAQLLAYTSHKWTISAQPLEKLRIKLPHQIIAALYTLAAISKLKAEGLSWVLNYQGFAVQVNKSWLYRYVTNGEIATKQKAESYFQFIVDHPMLITFGLATTLALEGLVLFSLCSRKAALFWGTGLFLMHIGIFFVMDIFISATVVPMVIFMINPPALVLTIKHMLQRSDVNSSSTG